MLESVELINWKTHRHTKLNFSNGTNILLGPMGAGKSSIMDAISFALFGTYPAIQHRRVAVNEIITSRPEQKDQATVRLSFRVDSDSYEVERSLELNGSAKARIAKNGSYVQSQPKRVNEEVERILKVDYDLFSRAIYSEQNRLSYFLELRPADRKKQIDGLLGLDKFATAQENSTSLINKIKDMISENERTMTTFDIKKLREQYGSLLEEANGLRESLKELRSEAEKQEKERADTEKKLNEAKSLYNRKTVLTREIAELKSKADVIGREVERIEKRGVGDRASVAKALKEMTAAFEVLKKNEKEATDKEKAVHADLVDAESEMKGASRELSEKEKLQKEYEKKDRKKVEDAVKSATDELGQLRGAYEANVAGKNENEKWLRELEKHISKCPVCERELTKDTRDRILDERRETVKRLDEEIRKQKQRIEVLEKDLEKDSKELQRLSGIEERLAEYKDVEKRISVTKERLERMLAESERVYKKKKEASDAISKAREGIVKLETEKETVERLEEHVLEKEKVSKALEEKKKELGRMDVSEEMIDKLQKSFTTISSKIRELNTKLESSVSYEKEKTAQTLEKKREVELVEKMHEDMNKKKKAVENITKFKNALEETQTVLRGKLIGSINEIMQEVWPELYPYGDYQGIMLEPTSDDYVLKVRTVLGDTLRWEDVDAIASGGEKSVACLAMRVAFALVLVPNLRWIILDEPTHNIDQQGLSKFVKAISDVMPKIVEQVFIITHDEILKQVANARIYLLARNKEESGETIVETF